MSDFVYGDVPIDVPVDSYGGSMPVSTMPYDTGFGSWSSGTGIFNPNPASSTPFNWQGVYNVTNALGSLANNAAKVYNTVAYGSKPSAGYYNIDGSYSPLSHGGSYGAAPGQLVYSKDQVNASQVNVPNALGILQNSFKTLKGYLPYIIFGVVIFVVFKLVKKL